MATGSVTVDAPIDDVFALLADLTTSDAWNPDALSTTQLTDGPLGLSTRFQHKIKGVGDGEVEITVYEEPRRVEFRGNYNMGEVRHLFSLAGEGDRTRVDQVLEMHLKGLWRLMAPAMPLMLRSGVRVTAGGLARHFPT